MYVTTVYSMFYKSMKIIVSNKKADGIKATPTARRGEEAGIMTK